MIKKTVFLLIDKIALFLTRKKRTTAKVTRSSAVTIRPLLLGRNNEPRRASMIVLEEI
jgi:hypothetical protein